VTCYTAVSNVDILIWLLGSSRPELIFVVPLIGSHAVTTVSLFGVDH